MGLFIVNGASRVENPEVEVEAAGVTDSASDSHPEFDEVDDGAVKSMPPLVSLSLYCVSVSVPNSLTFITFDDLPFVLSESTALVLSESTVLEPSDCSSLSDVQPERPSSLSLKPIALSASARARLCSMIDCGIGSPVARN